MGTLTQMCIKIDPETLRKTLDYNPVSGSLIWKNRDRSWFKSNASYTRYHKLSAGKPALTADNGEGYLTGTLLGNRVKAHQVIWLMVYGESPPKGYEIDHINGIRSDNRLENLRCVKKEDNAKNQSLSERNQTGVLGVSFYKPNKKWLARINALKKTKFLGYFDSFEEACKARKDAEIKYNYHENHGKTLNNV